MNKIFDEFPYLENDYLIIKKMSEENVDDLMEITNNDNIYKYIPYFLYKKSKNTTGAEWILFWLMNTL